MKEFGSLILRTTKVMVMTMRRRREMTRRMIMKRKLPRLDTK